MAMKPAGTAILVGLVALTAVTAIWYSGVLDAKPEDLAKKSEPAPVVAAPAPEPAQVAAHPAPAPQPVQKNDAFDALIRQSGNK